ncbi:hypothetical protein KA005_44500, partial [bacterium]|nr:hypothetical protein [bacterium]
GRYNDGSGTTYDLGGIASSSSSNSRWASYYADHDGLLSDNFVNLLERATLEVDFQPPAVPKKVGDKFSWGNFRYYTNLNIITNLTNLLRKSDDNIGSDLGKYAHKLVYKGIPFMYVKELNTARSTLYGTDPLYGVNHDHFKMKILRANDFVQGKPKERGNMHNVLRSTCDLSYAITCDNRQAGGFLISQQ